MTILVYEAYLHASIRYMSLLCENSYTYFMYDGNLVDNLTGLTRKIQRKGFAAKIDCLENQIKELLISQLLYGKTKIPYRLPKNLKTFPKLMKCHHPLTNMLVLHLQTPHFAPSIRTYIFIQNSKEKLKSEKSQKTLWKTRKFK